MMADQVIWFIEGLIEKTKNNNLEWYPFSLCEESTSILNEIYNDDRAFVDWNANSVRVSNSYYLRHGDGYVFLLEIYHGDPDQTSPMMDTIGLWVKIHSFLPIDDLSNYSAYEQERLEELKLLIDNSFSEKYVYPDVLYDFMSQVLEKEDCD